MRDSILLAGLGDDDDAPGPRIGRLCNVSRVKRLQRKCSQILMYDTACIWLYSLRNLSYNYQLFLKCPLPACPASKVK